MVTVLSRSHDVRRVNPSPTHGIFALAMCNIQLGRCCGFVLTMVLAQAADLFTLAGLHENRTWDL